MKQNYIRVCNHALTTTITNASDKLSSLSRMSAFRESRCWSTIIPRACHDIQIIQH
jgi:hypothetical protein